MAWNKPLPHPTEISQPFWDGLKAHEVRIQQCEHGHWLFFPRTHCPTCGSRKLAWRTVSGAGKLYSFTVSRVPTLPEFTDEMPQLLAVVELDEGPHLNTTLVGVDPADIKIGQRLRPVFDDRPGEVTLLRYTPLESAHAGVISGEPVAEAPATTTGPLPHQERGAAQERRAGHDGDQHPRRRPRPPLGYQRLGDAVYVSARCALTPQGNCYFFMTISLLVAWLNRVSP